MKFDGAAVRADFPGHGQAWLKRLCLPIQSDQDAARQVPNAFGSIFLHQQRIESFRFAAKTKMEFAARLDSRFGARESWPAQSKGKGDNNPNAAYHWATSCDGRTNRKHMTTITRRTRGTSLQGFAERVDNS